MPKDVESWYQEIGRAGRDGLESDCVLFYSWADVKAHERFLDDIDDPEVWRTKRQATVRLFELAESPRCRHQSILAYFDEAMEPCGDACDSCTRTSVADRAAEAMMRQSSSRQPRSGVRGRPAGRPRDDTNRPPLGSIATPRSSAVPPAPPSAEAFLDGTDASAFRYLRAVRKQLADAAGVPAYIVFNDAVLQEMASRRPSTPGELLAISGVGPAKLEKYGEAFLAAVAELA
jgi:ATP-dependent DNA helicase RecQ